ncbi:MAG: GNAT family N-acetyltransferase [Pseudomonadota bacterium]
MKNHKTLKPTNPKWTIVVYKLEMTKQSLEHSLIARSSFPPLSADYTIEYLPRIDVKQYLQFYQNVGQDYFWWERTAMDPVKLQHILLQPNREVYIIKQQQHFAGFGEIKQIDDSKAFIDFFGLQKDNIAKGVGNHLMQHLVKRAFAPKPNGFNCRYIGLETCSLDHPRAFDFYKKNGFYWLDSYHIKIEDPRLKGYIPADIKPQNRLDMKIV